MSAIPGGRDGGEALATIGYDRVVRLWDVEAASFSDPSAIEDGASLGTPPQLDSTTKRNDSRPAVPLRNLSPHAAAGWPAVVLAGCEEATAIRRKRAQVNPDAYEPDLATSLHNLSIRYGACST